MNILKIAEYGMRNIKSHIWTAMFPIIYLLSVFVFWKIEKSNIPEFTLLPLPQLYVWIFNISMVALSIIGTVVVLALLGIHIHRQEVKLSKIHYGEKMSAPKIVSILRKGDIITYKLFSTEIPLSVYKNNQEKIETALNMFIQVKAGKDNQHTIITGTSANKPLPNLIEWSKSYLSQDDFVLNLGVNTATRKRESIDISSTPHILLGGGTGSGKTVLLKLLLMQCLNKGAEVKICDFKGGVDFSKRWHEKCEFVTSAEEMKKLLENAVNILEERQKMLSKIDNCTNIQEYNTYAETQWNHIIIACDESADIFDTTGKTKGQKALTAELEGLFLPLARKGRFAGIHLIFATQRPSADVINSDIKANLGHRICGRCDSILSKIILDNTDGAEMVSQDSQGLFLTNTGALFKAYYLHDDCFDTE